MEDVLIRFRLIGEEARALLDVSSRELRNPRDQVRFILRQDLKRRGLVPLDVSEPVPSRGEVPSCQGL